MFKYFIKNKLTVIAFAFIMPVRALATIMLTRLISDVIDIAMAGDFAKLPYSLVTFVIYTAGLFLLNVADHYSLQRIIESAMNALRGDIYHNKVKHLHHCFISRLRYATFKHLRLTRDNTSRIFNYNPIRVFQYYYSTRKVKVCICYAVGKNFTNCLIHRSFINPCDSFKLKWLLYISKKLTLHLEKEISHS